MYQNTPCGLILEQDAKLNSVKTFKAQYPGGLTKRFYPDPVHSIRQQPHHTSLISVDSGGFTIPLKACSHMD
ncbi:hypothetical protein [Planktothrix sp.]|uniref:hypothetical protein n=1 Tax=Planktothrix sp. TaxID=3088171 RepID=UPI0038D4A35C